MNVYESELPPGHRWLLVDTGRETFLLVRPQDQSSVNTPDKSSSASRLRWRSAS